LASGEDLPATSCHDGKIEREKKKEKEREQEHVTCKRGSTLESNAH
jgi:hypothetical protein